ncbi:NAD(P)H-quinone oxidoreductase [Gracilibacillus caseinilyticus]|uniref:NAD(P)H-quinone oxidoreductase n=1 Tax=Gracilibacillus caseinilyticus TaxID=2932256 RepID=A0ABY4EQC1_9BACI|nr:NAD(P)H-quinone oxidoreductase [Gracilibacillus caseinilyticus]UOQ46645.1 NAD(P)H-quinone oxidoreductase [Gracilibacillus caseinilyticus]
MKAVITKEPGGADQLTYVEQNDPTVASGDMLIEVHATAVNRTDILNREGKIGYAENPIIGVEIAGVVVDPNGHDQFTVGERVMGLVNGGGYAEKVAMPVDRAMSIPSDLSFEQAAAIPEVFLTAYQTLYWIGKLQKSETVLIHAGGSGVGTAAIQLAKKLSNARVIVTAGSEEKVDFCKKLGADVAINYKTQAFEEEVLQATDQKGADVILDFVGASYWQKNYRSIAVDGRWVLIGVLGGSKVDSISLMDLMAKRIQLTGTLLTPRSDPYKAELSDDFLKKTSEYFEDKSIKPVVDQVFPIEEVADAHRHMESNKNIGKIILKVR